MSLVSKYLIQNALSIPPLEKIGEFYKKRKIIGTRLFYMFIYIIYTTDKRACCMNGTDG